MSLYRTSYCPCNIRQSCSDWLRQSCLIRVTLHGRAPPAKCSMSQVAQSNVADAKQAPSEPPKRARCASPGSQDDNEHVNEQAKHDEKDAQDRTRALAGPSQKKAKKRRKVNHGMDLSRLLTKRAKMLTPPKSLCLLSTIGELIYFEPSRLCITVPNVDRLG